MDKTLFAISSGLGFVGVGAGAFGAHALKTRISPEMLAVFQTGVLYHLVHAVAIAIAAIAVSRWPGATTVAAGWLFAAGVLLFSGSLYLLAITGIRALGAVTPLGGLCFLGGWLCLFLAAVRS